MSLTANISNISRSSLHDGPGVRTVVYFKGCPLRCRWCHNPETLDDRKDILYAPGKCIHCGRCVRLCPECHEIREQSMVFLRQNCRRCGRCAEECPAEALTVSGTEMSLEQVFQEAVKDRHYYAQSGGGVTFSGGECLLQADFCAALAQKLKAENIHTAVETALFVPWANVEKMLPCTDLFFADFKIAQPQKHRHYTGETNERILANLARLAQEARQVVVRIPLIPGVNDAPEDVQAFAEKLSPFSGRLSSVEVLKYNHLARAKYALAGRDYADFGQAQQDEQIRNFCQALQTALHQTAAVFASL